MIRVNYLRYVSFTKQTCHELNKKRKKKKEKAGITLF
jgi:hypothetical protein